MAKPKTDDDEQVEQEIKEVTENPPEDLEDWPDGPSKYKTMGGPEGDSSYEEGPTSKLGPSGVRYHEDGRVTVDGEEVDNPDDYKGDPIPGGPTDPDAPNPDESRLKSDDQ